MPSSQSTLAVVNAGSSSLKVSLFQEETLLTKALIDRLGESDGLPRAKVWQDNRCVLDVDISASNCRDALAWFLDKLQDLMPGQKVIAYGHRVVHGGDRFIEPTRLTSDMVEELESCIPLAPLHLPHNLAPIRYLSEHYPKMPQVVCFDTAFHASQTRIERMYALPREYYDIGVKKYGFHGLSYEFIASELSTVCSRSAKGKTIVCHLGNGASLCAMHASKSVASSMGFTALEGIPMGTRTGSIDPGVLLYLLDREGMTSTELSNLLYRKSGLLGMSGISADMRDLLSSTESSAAEAIEHFCHRIACEIGRLTATLEGLDTLVFTAGIGENAPSIRERICQRCGWLGLLLDGEANERSEVAINTKDSKVQILVVPTNEELVIARHTLKSLS